MQTIIKEFLISTSVACGLFSALKIDPPPKEPTLEDWVGEHEAHPMTEALVSDPSVDEGVRRLAREIYSIPKILPPGSGRSIFDGPTTESYFSGRDLVIQIEVPEQPEARWMLDRTVGKNGNQLDFYDCYHNGMLEDIPVEGRLMLTFDVVEGRARVLQRRVDGVNLEEIGACVENILSGRRIAEGIHELVTMELTYEPAG